MHRQKGNSFKLLIRLEKTGAGCGVNFQEFSLIQRHLIPPGWCKEDKSPFIVVRKRTNDL